MEQLVEPGRENHDTIIDYDNPAEFEEIYRQGTRSPFRVIYNLRQFSREDW